MQLRFIPALPIALCKGGIRDRIDGDRPHTHRCEIKPMITLMTSNFCSALVFRCGISTSRKRNENEVAEIGSRC